MQWRPWQVSPGSDRSSCGATRMTACWATPKTPWVIHGRITPAPITAAERKLTVFVYRGCGAATSQEITANLDGTFQTELQGLGEGKRARIAVRRPSVGDFADAVSPRLFVRPPVITPCQPTYPMPIERSTDGPNEPEVTTPTGCPSANRW